MLLPHGFEECQERWRHDHASGPMGTGTDGNQGSQVFPGCEEPLPPAIDGGTGYLGKCIMERLPPVLCQDVQGMEPKLCSLGCSESEGCLHTMHEDTIRGSGEFGKTIPNAMKICGRGRPQRAKAGAEKTWNRIYYFSLDNRIRKVNTVTANFYSENCTLSFLKSSESVFPI